MWKLYRKITTDYSEIMKPVLSHFKTFSKLSRSVPSRRTAAANLLQGISVDDFVVPQGSLMILLLILNASVDLSCHRCACQPV